jgi:Secretion system C-terminal sorting domain
MAVFLFFILWDTFLLKMSIFTTLKKTFTILLFLIGINTATFAQQKLVSQRSSAAKVMKSYPNPATSVINFDIAKGSDNFYTLQLFNFMGRKVGETIGSAERISFLLDGFYRGVYIYQLKDRSGKIVDSGKFQVIK